MVSKLLTFILPFKKYLLIGLAVVLLLVFSYQGLRIVYLKNQVNSLKADIAIAKVKQMEGIIKSLNEHNARLNEIKQDTANITSNIKSLKIEGRCIKDEEYYRTADSIIKRFNRVQ